MDSDVPLMQQPKKLIAELIMFVYTATKKVKHFFFNWSDRVCAGAFIFT